ncbi:hypothetical protein P4V41_20845 [Fictibacillus nanhaiensis]|uniref:hypothetical protein n=1 Tax=Fictibacillus nanhaiensis TaxID=742169 RepID=UPI002E1E7C4B|nr:hypothetical protein [Fictibacillus nanhaiensis]
MKNIMLSTYVKVDNTVKGYLETVKNERGSQSLEWIAIAAIVVIITGLISKVMKESEIGSEFFEKFSGFIDEVGKTE